MPPKKTDTVAGVLGVNQGADVVDTAEFVEAPAEVEELAPETIIGQADEQRQYEALRLENERMREELRALGQKPEPSAETILGDPKRLEEELVKRVLGTVDLVRDYTEQQDDAWYCPDKRFENWHFVRCGLDTDPIAVARANKLLARGFVKAPSGTYNARFASDGNAGINLMAPEAVHEIFLAREREAYLRFRAEYDRSYGNATDKMRATFQERFPKSSIEPVITHGRGGTKLDADLAAVSRAVLR